MEKILISLLNRRVVAMELMARLEAATVDRVKVVSASVVHTEVER